MSDDDTPSVPGSERACGCVLAAACGDALGAPFEGALRVDAGDLDRWAAGDEPLRYTDDTAMLLTLTEYLAESPGIFDESELVHRFARAWREEPDRGYGSGPPAIFRQVLRGTSWKVAADQVLPGGSFGNGGAMRVAPVGLLGLSLDDTAALARRSARVTHAHPLAQDGAATQAMAVALAARSNPTEPIEARDVAGAVAVRLHTAEFAERLQTVRLLVESSAGPLDVADQLGNDLRALTSVPAALTAFLREPDDITAAIGFAIRIGGDTDTIAAMTGALVGARCGEEALPGHWLSRLERRERLAAAARQLCVPHR